MYTVALLFMTPEGDELGRRLLANVAVASPEEAAETSTSPGAQMLDMYECITEAVTSEHLEIALEPLDFQMQVSRALLSGPTEGELLLPLPVRPATLAEAETVMPQTPDALDLPPLDDGSAPSTSEERNTDR